MNKKIVTLAIVSLMVLSMFSATAFATGKKKVKQPVSLTAAPASIALPSERPSKEYKLSLNSCQDAKLRRGDTAVFTLNSNEYTIRQGLAGERYMQLELAGFSDRFYPNGYKRYDLDGNGKEDLQIALYELLNGKTHLVICSIDENKAGQVEQPVAEVQETLSLFDRVVGNFRSWFN